MRSFLSTLCAVFLVQLIMNHTIIAQNNTSLGTGAGNAGINNTSIGHQAGDIIIANYNTFIGYYAGLKATNAYTNVFVGAQSGMNTTTGSSNTFLGRESGRMNLTGSSNVYVGQGAGFQNTIGRNNVILGTLAGHKNQGNGNVFVGNLAGFNELGSDKLYIANSNTTTPLIYGDFAASALNINGSLQADYLTVDPQDNANEGGEIMLLGAGANPSYKVENTQGQFRLSNNNGTHFTVTSAGNIGIGTSAPGSFKVAVEGKLGAREIRITQVPVWPDYVFASNYKLLPLEKVEQFINRNHHLPAVPSAKIVEKEGIEVGKMNATLLRKIEELTLYMISVNKEVKQMQQKIQLLEKENQQLKKQLNK
ncbi:MAG TPA: hypothetical protein DCS93_39550 [Microscillaceae bacterium]|nr:hypothetical protein [Microscillaceae bacterium]